MLDITVDFSKAALRLSEFKTTDHARDDITGFLDSLCDKLSDPHNAVFKISGFGDANWPVDSLYDLPVFLEQLPSAIQALRSDVGFEIDFYSQGMGRNIIFSVDGNTVYAKCQSLSSWQPNPTVEALSKQDLRAMLEASMNSLISFVEDNFPEDLSNPIFIKWKNFQ